MSTDAGVSKTAVIVEDDPGVARIIEQVLADFQAGKEKAIGFLVGQIMRQTKGRANPELVNRILKEKLAGM